VIPPLPTTSGLRLTPEGVLVWDGGHTLAEALRKPLEKASAASPADALLLLCGPIGEGEIPDDLRFWREFAKRYLVAVCHLPRLREDGWQGGPALPDDALLAEIISSAPPAAGMEYLSVPVLQSLWQNLNDAIASKISRSGNDTATALADIHPVWRLVGRVTLHLAENKRSPEYPFAFLATFSHRVDASSQVQYLPLAQALKEGAAQQDKSQLLTLLAPLKAGAQQSRMLSDLIESKQIFQPLAWTPTEAFQFL